MGKIKLKNKFFSSIISKHIYIIFLFILILIIFQREKGIKSIIFKESFKYNIDLNQENALQLKQNKNKFFFFFYQDELNYCDGYGLFIYDERGSNHFRNARQSNVFT